jgi:hypothetical protein
MLQSGVNSNDKVDVDRVEFDPNLVETTVTLH